MKTKFYNVLALFAAALSLSSMAVMAAEKAAKEEKSGSKDKETVIKSEREPSRDRGAGTNGRGEPICFDR